MKYNMKDLTGQRFGELTVISPHLQNYPKTNRRRTVWLCRCDCGNETFALSGNLTRGNKKFCETHKKGTHRHSAGKGNNKITKTYSSWQKMKNRCLNPNHDTYKHYGGRGIKICDRWINCFENFLADMGERPDGKTLDRIDSNGNYEPGNCKWSTQLEQTNNQRKSVRITYRGETHTIAEWGRILNIKIGTVKYRFDNGLDIGMPVQDTKYKKKPASPKTSGGDVLNGLT
jgi:hypothetical protein